MIAKLSVISSAPQITTIVNPNGMPNAPNTSFDIPGFSELDSCPFSAIARVTPKDIYIPPSKASIEVVATV